jgi:formylglycine-generating enzyme required for sulfatase activity
LAAEASSALATVQPCRKGTLAVTKLEASPLGVVGMAGNAKEWTMDLGPMDSKGRQSRIRVARGGGWRVYGNLFMRVETPMVGELGFRCAAPAP